jgi:periplasmic divalent cation tolerance protein
VNGTPPAGVAQPGDSAGVLLALCTAPAEAANGRPGAEALARALVEARVAACVNVVPGVHSVYRWQGAVETGSESLLVIKTTAAAWPTLVAVITALHPYELPEIVAVPLAAGLPRYLAWVAGAVTPPPE